MTQVSPAISVPVSAGARPAAPAAAGAALFSLALTSIQLPRAGTADAPEPPVAGGDGRQSVAGGGKELPLATAEGAPGEDDAETAEEDADPAFAWFAAPLPVMENPVPVQGAPANAAARMMVPLAGPSAADSELVEALRLAGQVIAPADAAGAAAGTAPAVPVQPDAAAPQAEAAAVLSDLAGLPAVAPAARAPGFAPRAVLQADEAGSEATVPARIAFAHAAATHAGGTALAAVPAVAPRAVPAEQVAPAALSFTLAPQLADALAPATARRPAALARDAALGIVSGTLTPDAPRTPLTPGVQEVQQPVLDMRRHEWIGAMVERIEALRDAAGLREANIRLAPDALGTVDVSIRREGDALHVHFAADSAATRSMISEAQPRLAELAEARGLRLAGSSVDAGTAGQGGQRQDPAPRAQQLPSAPPPARADGAAADESDQRIA
ncbi:flagellar hook-length control protein FliK [Sphingomonas canadensis]|uniref:Flagellar hook-length control protein FliK n=1 Tax=Sphingomonas canadensis TaxID=1219257 RepID=A0ABW3H1F3_9SPHN|nr:flagellar hook-length control protein FliK [Sphingomonas canadensis]MCW3834822.1 flagellar hook-length control protein FliK [Sphingomonas canadensis]